MTKYVAGDENKQLDLWFFEISARTGKGVNELCYDICKGLLYDNPMKIKK